MALHQHLLYSSRKGEVPFKREWTIRVLRLTTFCLVAIGMESVWQAEAFGKRFQFLCRSFPIKSTGFHIPEPTIRITAPPVRTHFLQTLDGCIDNLLGFFSLAIINQS